jgi:hypothetical protein
MQNVNSFTEMFGNNDFTNNSIANSCDDNIRTTDSRLDTFQDTERNSKKSSEIGEPESDINVNIFRYRYCMYINIYTSLYANNDCVYIYIYIHDDHHIHFNLIIYK